MPGRPNAYTQCGGVSSLSATSSGGGMWFDPVDMIDDRSVALAALAITDIRYDDEFSIDFEPLTPFDTAE